MQLQMKLLPLGSEVILVSGPADDLAIHPGVTLVQTKTADEMHTACLRHFRIVIF